MQEKGTVVENYELLEGLVRVEIIQSGGSMRYHVIEDEPLETERKKIDAIIAQYRSYNVANSPDDFSEFFGKSHMISKLGSREVYFLDRYYLGYGIIQPLMIDPRIEDISCDGVGIPIFVFIKEYGYLPTSISFNSEGSLNFFIRKLVQDGGKQISVSVPVVETTLRDGSRLSASLGRYVTTRGPSFSVRRFREVPLSPVDLMNLTSATAAQIAYLWTIVDYGSNIMVVGGTATGKTTFLNAILSFVSPEKKIVTIEDTKELNLKHENWISTVSRTFSGSLSKQGSSIVEIDMFDLLESALRHRPNYIVVGEVRGAETFTVFQAMLAGRFGMGTFHADDMETFIHRLEARPISIPRSLITSLNAAVILDTSYSGGKLVRRVKEISEIVNVDPGTGELIVNRLADIPEGADAESFDSNVFRIISAREGIPYGELVDQMARRMRVLERLSENGISSFDQAMEFFSLYKSDQEAALRQIGLD